MALEAHGEIPTLNSRQEAARKLHISLRKLDEWIAEKEINVVRLEGIDRVFITDEEIARKIREGIKRGRKKPPKSSDNGGQQ